MNTQPFRVLREGGLVSKIGSFEIKRLTSKELLDVIGNASCFRFARQFVESHCFWYSCPLVDDNLIHDFLSSLFTRQRNFRNVIIWTGSVDVAKYLLIERDKVKELYVSNEETRDYVLSLQDLNLLPIS